MSEWKVNTKGGGSTVPILEDDMYDAVCVWMIDLGTQQNDYQGETKVAHKCMFVWAVDGETVDIDGEARPRVVSKEYTVSLHERATLRKDLEGWRGKSFDAEGLDTFDISKVLEKPCRLLVGHTSTGRSNKVEAVKAAKKQIAIPDGIDVIFFKLDEWEGGSLPENIPDWIKRKIADSPEYAAKADKAQDRTVSVDVSDDSEETPF